MPSRRGGVQSNLSSGAGPARKRGGSDVTAVVSPVKSLPSAVGDGDGQIAASGGLAPVRRQGDSTSPVAGTHADERRPRPGVPRDVSVGRSAEAVWLGLQAPERRTEGRSKVHN